MTNKTEVPFRNSAGEIYVPPPTGHHDAIPNATQEDDKEYSQAWDEALVLSKQKELRKAIEYEIERLEAYTPNTPKESLDKTKSLKALQQRLKSFTEPKRSNQRHKLKVQDGATRLWTKYPTWTIQKMCKSEELNALTNGREYALRTLRNWVKDFAPSNAAGRRKTSR